jgi:hypothetical protein
MGLAPGVDRKRLTNLWGTAVFRRVLDIFWAAAVVALPITSLPFLVDNTGASTVAPPSGVLFLAMLSIWLLPYVLKQGSIPIEVRPLVWFLAVAAVASAAAQFIEIPPYREPQILGKTVQGFATLIMGAGVFVVAAAWIASNPASLKRTLIFINLSGGLIIAWSLIQSYYAFVQGSDYPSWMFRIQHIFVARSAPFFPARVTGFAYEPSWLAHQLNMIYLPFWLSATLYRFTAHSRRILRLTVENLLLGAGVVVLIVSFSRVGFLSFTLMLAFLAIKATLWVAYRLQEKIVLYFRMKAAYHRMLKHSLVSVLMLAFLAAYAGIILGAAYLGSFVEPRLQTIFATPIKASSFYQLTNHLAFAERVVYWATGWEIFNQHPMLGVGLGNSGFFFSQNMPAFGYALTEISDTFYRYAHLPNTKSMWVRILAETGLVGFALFITWYYVLWRSGGLAKTSSSPVLRVIGLAGQLALVGFLIEGFSIDSFALPYFWFSAGLLSAAAFLTRKTAVEKVE